MCLERDPRRSLLQRASAGLVLDRKLQINVHEVDDHDVQMSTSSPPLTFASWLEVAVTKPNMKCLKRSKATAMRAAIKM
jgi:hypothetical protein